MTISTPADGSGTLKCIECGAATSPAAKFCGECGAIQTGEPSTEEQHAAAVPTFGYVQDSSSPWKLRVQSLMWGVLIGGVLIVLTASAVTIWNLSAKRAEVQQGVSAEEEQKRAEEGTRKRLMQPQVDWVAANLNGHQWSHSEGFSREEVSAQVDKPCSVTLVEKSTTGNSSYETACSIRLTGFPDNAVNVEPIAPQEIFVEFRGTNVSCRVVETGAHPEGWGTGFFTEEEADRFAEGFKKMVHGSCTLPSPASPQHP